MVLPFVLHMRLKISLLLSCLCLLAITACIKPHNDPDPDPHVVADSVEGYTGVNVDFYDYSEHVFGGQIRHFIIDSTVYVFNGGKFVYSAQMLKVRLSGEFESLKTYYTSTHTSEIHDVAFDESRGRFLVAGGIKDKYDYIYANPIFNVYDMDGNIIKENYYAWEQADNYFTGVQALPSDETALLVYEREDNYNYSYYRYFFMILNSSYDSIRRIDIPFDSITSVKYFNFTSPTEVQLVGVKVSEIIPGDPEKLLYKLFYMELSSGGMITKMNDLRDYSYGSNEGVSLDNREPWQIYYFAESDMPDTRLALERYSSAGPILSSTDIGLLNHKKINPFAESVHISRQDGGTIICGGFGKSNIPAAPNFYGSFLIKLDENMNEQYRLIFNKDIDEYYQGVFSLDVLDKDRFLLLNDYSFGFTMTILNAADTLRD